MTQRPGCVSALWRVLFLPLLVGAAAGFVIVILLLQVGQQAADTGPQPEGNPTVAFQSTTRIVVVFLDESGFVPTGVWQWWSHSTAGSQRVACVVSKQAPAGSSGRTVQEIITLALKTGDYSWVARNTQVLAALCGPAPEKTEDEVLFVTPMGLVALVDALDGIEIGADIWDGRQVKVYLELAGAGQENQRIIWQALAHKAAVSPIIGCESVSGAATLFRAYPAQVGDACSRLVWLLQRTPELIDTPN